MFVRRVTLFKPFGIEVRLDASWLIIAALVTWSLAAGLFPRTFPSLSSRSFWLMGLLSAVGLFASILIHELSHSLVARYYKLPMKGITLFIFGGVAEMGGEPRSPKVEFRMAIIGPITSIVLGALFWLAHNAARGWAPQAVGVFGYLGWINWMLAAFNLIPAYPLDGGRVLRAAMWHFKGDYVKATEIASNTGSAFGFLLMVFAFYQLFFGNLIAAIWYFLIGSFLRTAARMSYEQVLVRNALEGEPIRRFMRPDPVTVTPTTSIRQLVENYIYRYHYPMYPVISESQDLAGCVASRDIKEIPKDEWDRHSVSELMKPCALTDTVSPETDAMEVLNKIRETGSPGVMVTDHNHLLSVVSIKDIRNFLLAKMEMEGREAESIQVEDMAERPAA